jgi:hypothetical protein
MTRLRLSLPFLAAVVTASACADLTSTPTRSIRQDPSRSIGQAGLPATTGNFKGKVLNCVPKEPSSGSALIGPAGGDLIIGPHRLIVPPGALTKPVVISGRVPADESFKIDLEPHGLEFKKPAGLILDAAGCSSVPTIVYLIDDIVASDPVAAVYSHFWHTIAAPIWHFSRYAIAMRNCDGGGDAMLRRATRDYSGDDQSESNSCTEGANAPQ